MPWVKATREGLIGKRTASGVIVDQLIPFVALPCVAALHQWIWINFPKTGRTCRAIVLDVGPWNTQDAAYVFGSARPQAETGMDKTGRPTNGAAIDLGEFVWTQLGLVDNAIVEWDFCPPAVVVRGLQLSAADVAERLARIFPPPTPRRRSRPSSTSGPAGP